ncbi:MAG: universal stress protein, partial [Phycisphaerae bacterium]|nr:universal stress protein [Phycisphaerae bacterium]
IMVAVDFADPASAAVEYASRLALLHGAELTLVHAIEADTLTAPDTLDLEAAGTESLARIEASVRARGLRVRSTAEVGAADGVVLDAERRQPADLLVVGVGAQIGGHRPGLGRVADRLVRAAQAPVLAVPAGFQTPDPMVRTILVATDFSRESEIAARTAITLIAAPSPPSRIVVLHGCDVPADYGVVANAAVLSKMLADEELAARARLERWGRDLPESEWAIERIVRQGYAAGLIGEEARRVDADLIAVGTHGRSGLSRLLLGSVAERVLHDAPCPVLVAHQERAGDAAAVAASGTA